MTVRELISKYYEHNPDGHYFDYDTLQFFGESRSTMRILSGTAEITDICGHVHTCYTLSKYTRKHPAGPRRTYAFFDVETFREVFV